MNILKKLIKHKNENKIYYVNLDDIIIPAQFYYSRPSYKKISNKKFNYFKTGELEPAILGTDNILRDGYISYLIIKSENKMNNTNKKLPVRYVNKEFKTSSPIMRYVIFEDEYEKREEILSVDGRN